MQERKHERPRETGDGPSGGLFVDAAPTGGSVDVAHGPYRETLPVAEMTVAEIRHRFRDHLDIHPQAVGLVQGNEVSDSTRVRAGQTLMFVRPAGEKGVHGWC